MGSGHSGQCGCRGWRRQQGQALVEVAERQVAGASPGERKAGRPLEPRAGRNGHPKRRSPGWLTARLGGAQESVAVRKGLRSSARDDRGGEVGSMSDVLTGGRLPRGPKLGRPFPPLGPEAWESPGHRVSERGGRGCRTRAGEQPRGGGQEQLWKVRMGGGGKGEVDVEMLSFATDGFVCLGPASLTLWWRAVPHQRVRDTDASVSLGSHPCRLAFQTA